MGLKRFLKDTFTRYNGTSLNNVTVNFLLAPVFALMLYKYLTAFLGVPTHDRSYPLGGALPLTVYSTFFYCYCSTFFQPDLDQDQHRPGKHSFPFGSTALNIGVGRFLRWASYPINRIWYYLWQPYGELFTHRGVSHWPLVGVWLRVGYIYIWYIFCEALAMRMGVYSPKMRVIEYWCQAFFPWNSGFGTVGFYVFCLPVYISDIFHSGIDLAESYKKGSSFCPQTMKRGILLKIGMEIKGLPIAILHHLKDFVD
jgi:uncharacterized metal-binding protein